MYWVFSITFTGASFPQAKYGPQGRLSERRPKLNIVAVATQLVLDLESSSDFRQYILITIHPLDLICCFFFTTLGLFIAYKSL